MSILKDPRWAKQFGDFGEQLVMYLVGRQKKMKVALVDHAGADIIASDLRSNKRYAISVKSHTLALNINDEKIKLESKVFTFNQKNIEHLRAFSDSFQLEPTVSIVIVQPSIPQMHPDWQKRLQKNKGNYFESHEKQVIDVFIFLLDSAIEIANEGKPYFTKNIREGGFNFKFENSYFNDLITDPRIDHTRLSFDSLKESQIWDNR